MEELKPCPFCGSTNISSNECRGLTKENGVEEYYDQTACLDCGAMGPQAIVTEEQSADEYWNWRQCELITNKF